MKKITLTIALLFTGLSLGFGQTIAWTFDSDGSPNTATAGNGTVTATYSAGGTVLVSGVFGTGGDPFVFAQSATTASVTITFSAAVDLVSIEAGELSTTKTWTATPSGGSNSVRTFSVGTSPGVKTLNWTGVTSFTLTTAGGSNFAIDDFVIPSPATAPTVSSSAASGITSTGATLNGNVTSDGSSTITERGFVYSLTSADATPTVAEAGGANVTKVVVAGTTGSFNQAITGLTASTGYSFAAYAINAIGTTESTIRTFTTSAPPDTTPPSITSVNAPSAGTYKIGDNLDFTVNYDESVTVVGTPTIALALIGPGLSTANASYHSGTGSSSLIFRYTVQANDQATTSLGVSSPIVLNGGTMRDAANNNANLTFTSPVTAGITVDGLVPTVSSVTVPANGAYGPTTVLNFTVNFSEAVNVLGGTPQIAITLTSGTVQATYQGGTGTTALSFSYTIQAGDQDLDGISVGALSANGATLRDAAGNNANLTLNSVGATTGVIVGQPSITVTTGATVFNDFSSTYSAASTAKTYTVQGESLIANLVVSVGSGFQVSSDGTNFSTTLNLAPINGIVAPTTITVRLADYSCESGNITSTINHSSTQATSRTIDVQGAVGSGATISTQLFFVRSSATSVQILWLNPTGNTNNFDLMRATGDICAPYEAISTNVPFNAPSFTDTVVDGTTYFYKVRFHVP